MHRVCTSPSSVDTVQIPISIGRSLFQEQGDGIVHPWIILDAQLSGLAIRAENRSNSVWGNAASENQALRQNHPCQTGRPDASVETQLLSSLRLPSPSSHRAPSSRTDPRLAE